MRVGTIVWWSPRRKSFGIIESKTVHNIVERFFLHRSQIRSNELDEPQQDCVVRFEVSDAPPKRAGDAPAAMNVDVFAPGTPLETAKAVQS